MTAYRRRWSTGADRGTATGAPSSPSSTAACDADFSSGCSFTRLDRRAKTLHSCGIQARSPLATTGRAGSGSDYGGFRKGYATSVGWRPGDPQAFGFGELEEKNPNASGN